MRLRTRDWGLRIGAVLLLVLVHIGIWRPVRDALTEYVTYPIAIAVDTPRANQFDVVIEPRVVRAASGEDVYRYHMPAALSYLVVAVILVAGWPRRLYWLMLWGAHLGLGMVAYGAFLVGLGWTDAGFAAASFAQVYLVPALSLLTLGIVVMPVLGTEHRVRTCDEF